MTVSLSLTVAILLFTSQHSGRVMIEAFLRSGPMADTLAAIFLKQAHERC